MSDEAKTALSLVEYIEGIGVRYPLSDVGSVLYPHRDKLAADLRAVKAVRAFPTEPPDPRLMYTYSDGVEAVQALLEGK